MPAARAREAALALPDTVTVAVAELAGELEEGLLAFAVGTGLQVLGVMLGVRGDRPGRRRGAATTPTATAVRHGERRRAGDPGGRQVPISRPRLRTADRSAEVPLPTYQLCIVDRAARPRGHGEDAGQALHPPLPRRPRAHGRGRRGGEPARRPSRRCRAASSPPPRRRWPS